MFKLKNENNKIFDKIIVRMGGFHIIICLLRTIYSCVRNTGLVWLLSRVGLGLKVPFKMLSKKVMLSMVYIFTNCKSQQEVKYTIQKIRWNILLANRRNANFDTKRYQKYRKTILFWCIKAKRRICRTSITWRIFSKFFWTLSWYGELTFKYNAFPKNK